MQTITTIIQGAEENEELVFPVLMQTPNNKEVWEFKNNYEAICLYLHESLEGDTGIGCKYTFTSSMSADNKVHWKKFKGKIITTLSN